MNLIDINLLPKRERVSKVFFYLTGAVTGLGLIGIIIAFVLTNLVDTENSAKQGQLAQLQANRTELESRLNGMNTSNSAEVLAKAVEWTETYPIQSMDVIDRITSELPNRGYIENFSFNDSGAVSINVQFDTRQDAVFFYSRLKEQTWIKEVKMPSITSKGNKEDSSATEVPRYVAPFTITLDYEKLNALQFKKEGGNSVD